MAQTFVRSFVEQPDALEGMAAVLDFTLHMANHHIEAGEEGIASMYLAFRFMFAAVDELQRLVPRDVLVARKYKIAEAMPHSPGCACP